MHRLCSTVYTYCERIYLSEKFFIILLICCHQLKPVVLVNRWWSIWWNAELMGLQYVWWGFDISQYKIFWTYPGNLSTHRTARCYKSSADSDGKGSLESMLKYYQNGNALVWLQETTRAKLTWRYLTIAVRSGTTGKSWPFPTRVCIMGSRVMCTGGRLNIKKHHSDAGDVIC